MTRAWEEGVKVALKLTEEERRYKRRRTISQAGKGALSGALSGALWGGIHAGTSGVARNYRDRAYLAYHVGLPLAIVGGVLGAGTGALSGALSGEHTIRARRTRARKKAREMAAK